MPAGMAQAGEDRARAPGSPEAGQTASTGPCRRRRGLDTGGVKPKSVRSLRKGQRLKEQMKQRPKGNAR